MTVKKYIGKKTVFYPNGTHIWGVDEKGGHLPLLEIKFGKVIQDAFTTPKGDLNEMAMQSFQNRIGEFIMDSINEKLARTLG